MMELMKMVMPDFAPVESEEEDVELPLSSESTQSSDDEDGPPPTKRAARGTALSETARDGTAWQKELLGVPLDSSPIAPYAADESNMESTGGQNMMEVMEMALIDVDPVDSEAEDIELNMSSESEQSSDDEDSPPPRKRAAHGTDLTETATDGTVWRQEQLEVPFDFSPIAAYAADGEPTAKARRHITSRLQSFLCLVSLTMLQSVQEATVAHGKIANPAWFLTLPELMAFIAIVIMRGLVKLPAVHDYWSASLGHQRVKDIMPRDRFQDIMRHLRFDDRLTRAQRVKTDRFAAISELWGSFVRNCIGSYTPGRHITIDEQLFPTKTRCCFLQYISTKPDKFGIKFWVACDLQTKYVCNVIPYLGKDPNRPAGERLADHVVMTLMEPFLDKGRNVTTDNFFTSLKLAQLLHGRKTTILGTVNGIRRELPLSAKGMDYPLYTTKVFSTNGVTLTVYKAKPRRNVIVLSSMHSMVECDNSPRQKPSTITQYNSTKCGVDVMDQMVRDYSVRKATHRWPVSVFYNLIDMAVLNAHVLYQACTGEKERRAEFIEKLASELAHSYVERKKGKGKEEGLLNQPSTPSLAKRGTCQVRHNCSSNRATKQCAGCNKYTCGSCIIQKPWMCHYCA